VSNFGQIGMLSVIRRVMACNPVSILESCGCNDTTLLSRAMSLLSVHSTLVISVLALSFVLTADNALPLSRHHHCCLTSFVPPLTPSLVVNDTPVPFAAA
jgi:hypothetical protein